MASPLSETRLPWGKKWNVPISQFPSSRNQLLSLFLHFLFGFTSAGILWQSRLQMDNNRSNLAKTAFRKTRFSLESKLLVEIAKPVLRIDVIRDLLALGTNVNRKNCAGMTALHLAVSKKRPELKVVELLLDQGADIKVSDNKGNTPLHSAVMARTEDPYCQSEVVKALANAGANINALNRAQKTALDIALYSNLKINAGVIEELLKRGAKLKLKSKQLLLSSALEEKDLRKDLIKVLFDCGAIADADALLCALKNPNCTGEVVEVILSQNAELNSWVSDYSTSLHRAIHFACNVSTVEALLKCGADVNIRTKHENSFTPLHLAVTNEKCPPSVVEILLRYGADIEARCSEGFTPLMHAAMCHSDEKVLEYLLKKGADPNQMNSYISAIHCAFRKKPLNVNTLKILLKYGGDVNIAEPSKNITPLVYVLRRNYEINQVKELLKNGATLIPPSGDESLSPLRIILRNSYFSEDTILVIQEILKQDPSLLYEKILLDAVQNSNCPFEVFDVLVKQGAKVNHNDSSLKTPLHLALEAPRHRRNVIKLFLKHEAWYTCQKLPWKKALSEISEYSDDVKFMKLLVKYATLQKRVSKNTEKCSYLASTMNVYVAMYHVLCVLELAGMGNKTISNRHLSREISFDKLLTRKKESKVFEIFEDDILRVLTDDECFIYSDVIARKLKKSVLIKHALTRKICTRSEEPHPREIVLTADCIRLVAEYLSKDCIIHLLKVFRE